MTESGWKDRLSRYVYLKHEYYSLLDWLARLENDTQLPAVPQHDGSQRTTLKVSRLERAAIRKMEQEKQINEKLDTIEEEMDMIDAAIDQLSHPLHREVLKMRYIDCEDLRLTRWEEVATRLYGSCEEKFKTALWRLHDEAIRELEKMKLVKGA